MIREQQNPSSGNIPESSALIPTVGQLRSIRQNRYNPIRQLRPSMLANALDAFERGNLREAALLWETICDRDDTIKSVKPKREKHVSQLDMQVMADKAGGSAAEMHREVLEDFWTNVRAVNAYDRNEKGGFRRLVKQMMSCVSFRYAVHHIVWVPDGDRLRAVFEFVPLWLFENLTGKLRYLESPWANEGKDMDDAEWMVTTGDGLMIACSIAYSAKRDTLNDWLIFSEKFSMPGVLGRTSAKKGSAEGEAMRAAVESFGHDFNSVIYGDDGTHKDPIQLIAANGNPSAMPMPALIERVDRKIAALYRGADLSSMSSGKESQGTGASLQDKETNILLADDAELITETLADVSRRVIEWHFGRGVEPLARVVIVPPADEDSKQLLDSATQLADRGAPVSVSSIMDRLSIQKAEMPDDRLGSGKAAVPAGNPESLANAMDAPAVDPETDKALRILRGALAEDLQPLGRALEDALHAGDDVAVRAAIAKISSRMPDFSGGDALASALEREMLEEYAGGKEDVANGDIPGHPFRGNQHNKWGTERTASELERGNAAMDKVLTTGQDHPDAMAHPELGSIDFRYGNSKGGIMHIREKHGEETARRIPSMILSGKIRMGEKRVYVESPHHTVLLANDHNNSPANHWVITGYMHHEK